MPVVPIPPRLSLPAHVADVIRRGLAAGQWGERLPGERRLCAQLGVSRPTLRKALEQLRQAGVLSIAHGKHSRPACNVSRQTRKTSDTVLALTPESLERLPAAAVFVFDELRSILGEAGLRLNVRTLCLSRRSKPDTALDSLVTTEIPAACLLYQAERPVHRWFRDRRLPCVVFGTQDASFPLPALDLDQRATSRHAALALLRGGYPQARVALVLPDAELPGHTLMREGFHDALGEGARVFVMPNDPAALGSALDRILGVIGTPAGLLFARAEQAVGALGHLAIRRGLRVPADIGIISLADDPFLRFVQPALARYQRDDVTFARQLASLVVRAATRDELSPRMTFFMPEFVRGETVL